MSSLSRLVKEKKKGKQRVPAQIPSVRVNNIGSPNLVLLEHKHDRELAEEVEEIDLSPEDFAHCLFMQIVG